MSTISSISGHNRDQAAWGSNLPCKARSNGMSLSSAYKSILVGPQLDRVDRVQDGTVKGKHGRKDAVVCMHLHNYVG